MKSLAIALMICLVPLASSFAQSQDEKDKEKHQPPPPQQEPKKPDQPADKERQPDRDKPPQDREKQDRERQDGRQDKDKQQTEKQEKDKQDREHREPSRVQQGQTQTRDRQSGQQPGHGGQRIPDERFRANFGREHRFHVRPQGGGEVQRGEGPRFQYAGYWFELVEPWPAAWSYDDDCYIEYIDDDYYLFDDLHPGYRVLIIVVQ